MIVEVRMKQAEHALKAYHPEKELNGFLKSHFKQFPKMGSRDRREVAGLVYDAIRVQKLFSGKSLPEQIWLGSFLCELQSSAFVAYWTERFCKQALPEDLDFEAKLSWLVEQGYTADWQRFFPWSEQISSQIELQSFYAAHLVHPITWVRVKQRAQKAFEREMSEKAIEFEQQANLPTAYALAAGIKLDQLKSWQQGMLEVQDLASQQTAALFEPQKDERWLDACAGSGGKSLMLLDMLSELSLFVTDIREDILQRLHERFKRAGIRNYSRAVVDWMQPMALEHAGSFPKQYDVILADVPCSGSGTWAGTPEMLITQESLQIQSFVARQQQMTANMLPYLKDKGRLIYLTCSVYRLENEEVVDWLCAKYGLKLLQQQYFQASTEGGDVLFGAVLQK
ncbi:MAG: hypothetical protein ACK417_06385 [Bacteroidia bacterium]